MTNKESNRSFLLFFSDYKNSISFDLNRLDYSVDTNFFDKFSSVNFYYYIVIINYTRKLELLDKFGYPPGLLDYNNNLEEKDFHSGTFDFLDDEFNYYRYKYKYGDPPNYPPPPIPE